MPALGQKISPAARFRSYLEPVTESGCVIFMGGVSKSGYGVFWNGERHVGAHRHSYEANRGLIPGGLYVCHHCDVKTCVNPEHLFLGTNADNQQDFKAKGRKVTRRVLTHCPHGHEYSSENTYLARGRTSTASYKVCRICKDLGRARSLRKLSIQEH